MNKILPQWERIATVAVTQLQIHWEQVPLDLDPRNEKGVDAYSVIL